MGIVDEDFKDKDNNICYVNFITFLSGKIKYLKKKINLFYLIDVNVQQYGTVSDHSIMDKKGDGMLDIWCSIYAVWFNYYVLWRSDNLLFR